MLKELTIEIRKLCATDTEGDEAMALIAKAMQNLGERPMADIRDFHEKYAVPRFGSILPLTMQKFRVCAMFEELMEYCEAVGFKPVGSFPDDADDCGKIEFQYTDIGTATAAFDSLIDLVYFTLGTVHAHRFPFEKGWRRVHRANMLKKRVERASESKRGSLFDVVKPEGWEAPVLDDLIEVNHE